MNRVLILCEDHNGFNYNHLVTITSRKGSRFHVEGDTTTYDDEYVSKEVPHFHPMCGKCANCGRILPNEEDTMCIESIKGCYAEFSETPDENCGFWYEPEFHDEFRDRRVCMSNSLMRENLYSHSTGMQNTHTEYSETLATPDGVMYPKEYFCNNTLRNENQDKRFNLWPRRFGESLTTGYEDYIGRRVSKMFSMCNHGKWYDGTVTSVDTCRETGDLLFHIDYDDGDKEDIYLSELDDVLFN